MKKTFSCLLILTVILLSFSCKKEEVTPELDKEVRLLFPFELWSTNTSEFSLSPSYTHLIKFNKANYSNISSITFFANMSATEGNSGEIELYNVTDNVPIENTAIQVSYDQQQYVLLQSENILNALPEKEIDLAVRLRSGDGSNYVAVKTPFLILKRN